MSWRVMGPNDDAVFPTQEEAKVYADARNDELGIEADGEGSVDWIVVPLADEGTERPVTPHKHADAFVGTHSHPGYGTEHTHETGDTR